jgi:hypothetical protein
LLLIKTAAPASEHRPCDQDKVCSPTLSLMSQQFLHLEIFSSHHIGSCPLILLRRVRRLNGHTESCPLFMFSAHNDADANVISISLFDQTQNKSDPMKGDHLSISLCDHNQFASSQISTVFTTSPLRSFSPIRGSDNP